MYFDSQHIIYVYIIVILMFVLPLLIIARREKIFSDFDIKVLLKVFNKAIKYHIMIGVFAFIVGYVVTSLAYSFGNGNTFATVTFESAYAFVIIGIFIYLPCLAILNILAWLTIKVLNRPK